MVRWIRLFGNQFLGFWGLGLVLFAVQEIPYMLMPLFHLKSNPIMNMTEISATLNAFEKIFGSLCIALMIFVIHKDAVFFSVSFGREKLYFTLAAVILFANFFGWLLYFTGHQSFFVMMLFLVAMPPLYYVAIGFWRQNTPLTVIGAMFFVIHFSHVLGNLSGRSLYLHIFQSGTRFRAECYERIYKEQSKLLTLRLKLHALSHEYLRTLRWMRVREPVLPYRQMQSGTWKA